MHREYFAFILAGQLGFWILFAAEFAVRPAAICELLPAEVRCSGVSIGFNVCFGIFGGTTLSCHHQIGGSPDTGALKYGIRVSNKLPT
jgi:hypothetical protein